MDPLSGPRTFRAVVDQAIAANKFASRLLYLFAAVFVAAGLGMVIYAARMGEPLLAVAGGISIACCWPAMKAAGKTRNATTAMGLWDEPLSDATSNAPEASAVANRSASGAERAWAEQLASVAVFRPLDGENIDRLAVGMSQRTFAAGQVIIRGGDAGSNVFVVMSGRVRVVGLLVENSIELLLGDFGPGEIFGELGVLRQSSRSATVMALESTTCLSIPGENFIAALEASPGMSVVLLRVLAARIYEADRMLALYAPDPLTGLPGRRAFHELYVGLAASARRRHAGVLMITVDILHLQALNDRFSYHVGDEILRTVADALKDSSRATDLVARYGSDEFAAVLFEAVGDNARAVTTRVQDKLRTMASSRSLPLNVKCRFGFAFSRTPPDTIDSLLSTADLDMKASRASRLSDV